MMEDLDYSEDTLVEQPAISLFGELDWETINALHEFDQLGGSPLGRETMGEVILVRRLRPALHALNPHLPGEAIVAAIEELTRDRSAMSLAEANREVYTLLKDGVKVAFDDPNGEGRTEDFVRVVDWGEAAANDFLLVSQFWVAGELGKKRADLVGFVNGIPLVFVELKAVHTALENAYKKNLSDYKDTIPHLFWYNGLVILSNGDKSRIGSVTASWEHFVEWKKIDNEGEEGVVSLETMIRGTCERRRLLDIVENYTLFEEARGGLIKLVAKNHQYLGVENVLEAFQHVQHLGGRLGVFWHTQGSGKSVAMVFLAQKVLRKIPGNWTFVVVTDRKELDAQIYKKFARTGVVTGPEAHATSSAHLRQLLREDHRYVFTLIHKFRTEPGRRHPVLSERSDIIVFTDEAHRSQYDTLALNMRNALPNAAFIAFTGTPLIVGEERTREVFGDYVSVYNFKQSVDDNATVPLYYENRIPELQLTNDQLNDDIYRVVEAADLDEEQEKKLEREFARQYHLITRDDRLETIAADLVDQFAGRGFQGKAMVVCIDKATAVRMYDKVQKHWQQREADLASAPEDEQQHLQAALDYMRSTDMAVVVSQSQNEVADIRAKGADADRYVDLSEIDFEALAAKFARGRKRIEAEKLKNAVARKLNAMVRANRTRMNYLERFQQMIDEYNAGSANVEAFFEQLKNLAQALTEEEQRHVAQGLSEEELAVFDILTKPAMQLTNAVEAQVKQMARELLSALKQQRLVLDWRKRQESRAAVRLTIEETLDTLPAPYSQHLYDVKCAAVYQHVYESYFGVGRSIYEQAG